MEKQKTEPNPQVPAGHTWYSLLKDRVACEGMQEGWNACFVGLRKKPSGVGGCRKEALKIMGFKSLVDECERYRIRHPEEIAVAELAAELVATGVAEAVVDEPVVVEAEESEDILRWPRFHGHFNCLVPRLR